MNPADHLRAWMRPRRAFLNTSGLDRAAGRPVGTLARFYSEQEYVTLRYGSGLSDYYPFLALLGYSPLPLASDAPAG